MKWLLGVILPAVVGWFGGWLDGFLPTPGQVQCQVKEWWAEPAPGTRFTVLLARLDRDPDGSLTGYVDRALSELNGIDVHLTCQTLKLKDVGLQRSAHAAAEETAKQWLRQGNGDLLVWGEVSKDEDEKRLFLLRFVRDDELREPNGGAMTRGQVVGFSEYKIQGSRLDTEFSEELKAQLHAVVLSQINPVTEKAGNYLVELLNPVTNKLKELRDAGLDRFNSGQRGAILFALATALTVSGGQSGEMDQMEEAVTAYRAALEEYSRDRVPLDWAATQNNLGNALQRLGERERDPARLEEAVAAYRAALEERTRDRVPLDWAATQNNLGNALQRLGERERDPARLEEAVAAYRAALEEYSRDRVPLDWAMTQNNLGSALQRLGERERDPARLEEAVAAYRAALEERTRDRVPLDWATTQNNLGSALQRLGERERDPARLEEAVAAYRAALEERTRDRVPLDWAATQNNLGNALQRLGERERDPARLEEAVAAYRAALDVYEASSIPHYSALTKRNLVKAQALLNEFHEER